MSSVQYLRNTRPESSEDMMSAFVAALDQSVIGQGLQPGTLRDQLLPGRTLLVFLRHNG